jgi:hypothetical protein
MKGNVYTLTLAVLGALKLVTESFGMHLIDNTQVDSIANGISAVVAVVGIFMSHIGHKDSAPVAPDKPQA